MTASTHTQAVNANVETLWAFIENKGEWATLIPGYLHHELKSADEMIWVFEGDFGMIKKPVKVSLKVTAIEPQQKLSFSLEGLSDNINGGGYFEIGSQGDGQTISGHLDMKAG
ncbi:MAG: SRPBCC family protein, partial [Lysinibacillus sp.]